MNTVSALMAISSQERAMVQSRRTVASPIFSRSAIS